jgi:hypothetical protein
MEKVFRKQESSALLPVKDKMLNRGTKAAVSKHGFNGSCKGV